MRTELLSTNIHINGCPIPLADIHARFASSELGQNLREKVRFGRYKPEGIPNSEWQRLLGADANNLQHMPLTYGITRQFLYYCQNADSVQFPNTDVYTFTPQEQDDMMLAARSHDWGEAIEGDHMFDQKTKEHEEAEGKSIRIIFGNLFNGTAPYIEERIANVFKEVVEDRTSHTGRAFNAIERIGYLRAGLRAFDLSESQGLNGELQTALQWAANNVLLNQIPTLLDYAHLYPPVHVFLGANVKRVTQAFTLLPDELFNLYKEEEIIRNQKKYSTAQECWRSSAFFSETASSDVMMEVV